MIALAFIGAAFFLVALSLTLRANTDRLIDALEDIELRQVEREKAAGLDANKAARWQG